MPRLLFALLIMLLPVEAFAQSLQCDSGSPVVGTALFGYVDCSAYGFTNVFSGLNCEFQAVLNEVMSRMYCGLQYHLMYTLMVAMTLFVIIYAIQFTFGIAELTAKELVTRLIKMALIWSFAMNASWGVELAFNGLTGSIEMASTWAIKMVYPDVTGKTIFFFLDQILYNHISSTFSANSALLMGFIIALSWALFPLFCLFLYLFIKVMGILIRTLISYLLALTMIAFLIALAPLFVSFALFQITFHLFETWLRYLISMALQIVIVFAAVGVWIYVMHLFGTSFFENLMGVLRAYDLVVDPGASTRKVVRTVGVCVSTMQYTLYGYRLTCTGGVVAPTALVAFPNFIWFLFTNLITLCIICYTFDKLLAQIPDLAQKLAGPADAPKLYGGTGPAAVQMPGMFAPNKIQQVQQRVMRSGLSGLIDGVPKASNSVIDNFKRQASLLHDR